MVNKDIAARMRLRSALLRAEKHTRRKRVRLGIFHPLPQDVAMPAHAATINC